MVEEALGREPEEGSCELVPGVLLLSGGAREEVEGLLVRDRGSLTTMPSRLWISSRDRGRKGSEVGMLSRKSDLETEDECLDLGIGGYAKAQLVVGGCAVVPGAWLRQQRAWSCAVERGVSCSLSLRSSIDSPGRTGIVTVRDEARQDGDPEAARGWTTRGPVLQAAADLNGRAAGDEWEGGGCVGQERLDEKLGLSRLAQPCRVAQNAIWCIW